MCFYVHRNLRFNKAAAGLIVRMRSMFHVTVLDTAAAGHWAPAASISRSAWGFDLRAYHHYEDV